MTRLLLIAFLLLTPAAVVARADGKLAPKPTQGAAALETMQKQYEEAFKTWYKEYEEAYERAKKNGKEQGFEYHKPRPNIRYSPRFLAIAEKNPEGPEAFDALTMTLLSSSGPKPGTALETRAKAIKLLRVHYVTKPAIQGVLSTLIKFYNEDTRALFADIIARNPDRNVQVDVYKEQVAYCETILKSADSLKDKKFRETLVKKHSKQFVIEQLDKGRKAKIELEGLKKALREHYADLYTYVSIGDPARELKIQTLGGSEATLSSLKGKVVVLDIWATTCGPCKEMIPHEREMVARLKDKPFVLVSISMDEEKKTLTDFLAKVPMPWTHWWNGAEGGVGEAWDVRGYPTIYVIDAEGVVRHKQVGKHGDFEKTVDNLLKQMEPKKTTANE